MEKKRSRGVTIFGWGEIILGGAGTYILLNYLYYYIECLFHINQLGIAQGGVETEIAFICVCFSLPFPFLLWAGVGVIKLKPVGRIINYIFIILISISTMVLLVFHYFGHYKGYLILDIIVFLILFLPLFLFLINPNVKEQFK